MTHPEDSHQYWFDIAALDVGPAQNPFSKLKSMLPSRQSAAANHDALADFAQANGLGYFSAVARDEREIPLPSLVLNDACESVIMNGDLVSGSAAAGAPYMEIGNHGWRYWKAEGDGSPSRRGYIAIRHQLDLPHMYLASRGPGAATVLAAASAVVNVLGMFSFEGEDTGITAVDDFRNRATQLQCDLPVSFRAYIEARNSHTHRSRNQLMAEFGRKARAESKRRAAAEPAQDAARAELAKSLIEVPAAAEVLSELSRSFDIEVEREWIYVYSSYGELSTMDPTIWRWTFGTASLMVDLLEAWGADMSAARQCRWYTRDRIERPAKLDGELRTLFRKPGSTSR